jgi:predicted ATPase
MLDKAWKVTFRAFSTNKNDEVKLSELFPTLKKSKSPTFQALSNIKNDKVLFSEFILTIKYCKDYFPNFSAIKNDKVQLSASFSAIKNDQESWTFRFF